MKNNKGFTLVELLATLILLSLIMSLGTYSITSIIENSKQKNYELLMSNIKDAAESYYNECKYMPTMGCSEEDNGYQVTLGELVASGFLKGNNEDDSTSNKVTNPKNDADMSDCVLTITKNAGKISVSYDADCPK